MKEYIATFYSHYGAVCFKRSCQNSGFPAIIMPVPRNLSSSCGTCVSFQAQEELCGETLPQINDELEQIVQAVDGAYRIIYRSEE